MRYFKSYLALIAIALLFTGCELLDLGGSTGIISSHMSNQSVAGVQTLQVSPPEGVEVDSVQFYIDEFPFGAIITVSPFEVEWDTFNGSYTNGPHTIYVELNTILGEQITDSIVVIVAND